MTNEIAASRVSEIQVTVTLRCQMVSKITLSKQIGLRNL